ncbi:MAG: hypothetical protein WC382_10610 [Methanoregulaceae archaeon]
MVVLPRPWIIGFCDETVPVIGESRRVPPVSGSCRPATNPGVFSPRPNTLLRDWIVFRGSIPG